ncbi:MAG: response regulator, partial [Proteobacteria bacterium]|nr:response regulator [Pseudomonadota bacterium]
DFSKIEAGRLELEDAPFNLRDFMGETLRIMALKAHEKGLELAYRVSPNIVPDRFVGDPARFRQVLLNLVGNAIKFTDKGEVVVSVDQERQNTDKVYLRFTVKDTGIGIPKDKHETIFSAFQQADGSMTRRFGGTGLGLTVSSQLVDLMGGRIWVTSEPGQGSTFCFTAGFAVQADEKVEDELLSEIDIRGVRVLVVDDNASSREIIQEMLESWSLFATVASGIEEAQLILGQVERSRAPFELVLIDSDMPKSDGFSLVRWINSQKTLHSNVIMMLTSAQDRAQVDFKGLGIKASVTKPVRPSDLLDAIIIALGMKKHEPEVSIETSEQKIRPLRKETLRVLVAEDTPFNQKYIFRLLDRWGYEAVLAENGRKALEALSKESFDLVLMDVQMPEMDGLTATRAIRESEKQGGGHIPIIALTAHAMKGDRERCLEAGMDEYISKPISPDRLYHAIQVLVPAKEPSAVDTDASAAILPSFDKQSLLEAFEHDWSFFKDIVEMFVSDYPAMLDSIIAAVKAKDADTLQQTAHSLKGMLRNFQADAAAEKALSLENMARHGKFEGGEQICQALTQEVAGLKKLLLDLVAEVAS